LEILQKGINFCVQGNVKSYQHTMHLILELVFHYFISFDTWHHVLFSDSVYEVNISVNTNINIMEFMFKLILTLYIELFC